MRRISKPMAAALRCVPVEWGRASWPRSKQIHGTIAALRRRVLFEFRQIPDPTPDPRYAASVIGQVRLTEAGRAALSEAQPHD